MNNNDIEEDIKQYKELKKHKNIIANIDTDFFFNFVENILADRERLEKESKKNKDALEILNKMKKKYKIALFMVIRNSMVMPKGLKLGKTQKEINEMSYKTLCEVLTVIDFKRAEKMYKEGELK